MPTVLEHDGFVVRIYGPPREHPPPHVHVEHGTDQLVVIRLRLRNSPQRVWRVYGMKDRDVVRAFRIVEEHHTEIVKAWRRLHAKHQDH